MRKLFSFSIKKKEFPPLQFGYVNTCYRYFLNCCLANNIY